jgi:hypothetical protein
MMRTDLALIARVSGPEVSLWCRRLPCKRVGCEGMVYFMARPPGAGHHFQLEAPWPPGRLPKARPG